MRITSTQAALPQIKPAALRTFHAALQHWYAAHGRQDLPWRHTPDPYLIWLSEVMLQQTQVSTVLARFYTPFLTKFPTVEALARASQEAVLKAWEGLGYYTRARNLHAAAKQVVTEGGFHPSLERLIALPGIGRNTATAILAFAYHQPVAIMEANVKRIVARVFALEMPGNIELWAGAETLLNRAAPFDYNQAMMDIGSLICLPKNPKCTVCPANSICKGKGNPTAYPAPKVKKQTPVRDVIIEVREDAQGRLYLEPRAEKLLGGLYGFPQMPPAASNQPTLGTVTHTYSHFKLVGQVVHVPVGARANSPYWHSLEEIVALPLSTVDHKVLALVEKRHTSQKKSPKAKVKRRPH